MVSKIGLLGYSNIAKSRIIPALQLHKGFEIIKIGRRKINNKEILSNLMVESYENVIFDDEIEIIYISLPNNLHYKYCKLALENGKHVIVEKPISPNFNETLELVELSKSKNLLLIENFQFQFHKQFIKLKTLLEENIIGDIKYINISFCFPPFQSKDNIRYQKKLGGGALLDAGCYPAKIINLLFEKSNIEVLLSKKNYSNGYEVETSGFATILIDNKIPVRIYYGFENYYQNSIYVYGVNGIISNDRIFTAHPNVDTSIKIESNSTKDEMINIGLDNHFINAFDYYKSLIESNDFENENIKTLKQAKLLNELLNYKNPFIT